VEDVEICFDDAHKADTALTGTWARWLCETPRWHYQLSISSSGRWPTWAPHVRQVVQIYYWILPSAKFI
jgi:hypothetical protein